MLMYQVSQYGLYDALSKAMQNFLEGLHAVHTSRLQCVCTPILGPRMMILNNVCLDDTILDLWGIGPNRAPIDT